jgi:hypothetical protein
VRLPSKQNRFKSFCTRSDRILLTCALTNWQDVNAQRRKTMDNILFEKAMVNFYGWIGLDYDGLYGLVFQV